jgi:hypothetical protein
MEKIQLKIFCHIIILGVDATGISIFIVAAHPELREGVTSFIPALGNEVKVVVCSV